MPLKFTVNLTVVLVFEVPGPAQASDRKVKNPRQEDSTGYNAGNDL